MIEKITKPYARNCVHKALFISRKVQGFLFIYFSLLVYRYKFSSSTFQAQTLRIKL